MSGRMGAAVGFGVAAVLAVGGWAIQAQVRESETTTPAGGTADTPKAWQDRTETLLETPITLPFADETALSDVAGHLAKSLKIRVVLEPAGMARLDLLPEDTVQIDLPGTVRLRTALPLVLDPFGLTYRFVPEDDLLILTDARGAREIPRQILDELRDLHRDFHELRDLVEDMYDELMPDDGPKIRKPTMIEENPPPPDGEAHPPAARSRRG